MKKTLLKRICVLAMAVMILTTLFAGTASAATLKAPMEARVNPDQYKNVDRDPETRNKTRDTANKFADIAIDIGTNFIPFGGMIIGIIKGNSPRKEKTTGADTVISTGAAVIKNTIPYSGPIVTVVSGLVKKAIHWIFF